MPKISELNSSTNVASNDLLLIVRDTAGAPVTNKITFGNFANSLIASVPGSFVPFTNSYSLGSASRVWDIAYVSALSANGSVGSAGQVLYSNGTASYWGTITVTGGGGNVSTGDVTFDGVKVIGSGNNSGDGLGYSTLELVPDNNLYGNHQYIIVDPTAPNHIHLRAGGPQDGSYADLFLGGEKNYVRVNNGGVSLLNENINDNFYFYSNTQFTSGSWGEENGNYYIEFTTTNSTMQNQAFNVGGSVSDEIIVYWNETANTATLTSAGSTSSSGNTYRINVNEAPPSSPFELQAIEFHLFQTRINELNLTNNDFNVEVTDDVRITGNDIVSIRNNSTDEPITIVSDYDNTGQTWSFNVNGSLTFPDSTNQTTAFNFTANSSNWADPAPTNVSEAIDRLAALLKTLSGGTGA